jgi:N-acetylglutamate synthase-like GNAT family acetyltransferase
LRPTYLHGTRPWYLKFDLDLRGSVPAFTIHFVNRPYTIRQARPEEHDEIQQLIVESARHLSRSDYSDTQVEAAIRGIFGVDTSLISDGTYFVANSEGKLIGCGGWSRRRTLFGGDQIADRDLAELNPLTDAAKIRAFFIHPDFARQGIARAILQRCEAEASANGFRALELMSTMPGIKFYLSCGYEEVEPAEYEVEGVTVQFVLMRKTLS